MIHQSNGKSLKSVLENFERIIDENNRVDLYSGTCLSTKAYIKHMTLASIHQSRRKDQRNDGGKRMTSKALLATLDEMTDLTDAIICFNSRTIDPSLPKKTASVDKSVTSTEDVDEMSISSFHSGSRRVSSIISRKISVDSVIEYDGCGGSTTSSKSKNSAVARPSARIKELPRDIQIGSFGYDSTDDENSESDSDDNENDDERPNHFKSRYW